MLMLSQIQLGGLSKTRKAALDGCLMLTDALKCLMRPVREQKGESQSQSAEPRRRIRIARMHAMSGFVRHTIIPVRSMSLASGGPRGMSEESFLFALIHIVRPLRQARSRQGSPPGTASLSSKECL